MTTIAYRDGVMAADSAAYCGWGLSGSCRKIARNAAGDLAGAAGSAVYLGAFLRWFERGEQGEPPEAKRDNDSSDCGLIVRQDGQILLFQAGGFFEQQAPYFAIGSGAPEARGAMHAGASAIDAVGAAIDLDAYTGGPVLILSASGEPQ